MLSMEKVIGYTTSQTVDMGKIKVPGLVLCVGGKKSDGQNDIEI